MQALHEKELQGAVCHTVYMRFLVEVVFFINFINLAFLDHQGVYDSIENAVLLIRTSLA